jgi:hypothetical protein
VTRVSCPPLPVIRMSASSTGNSPPVIPVASQRRATVIAFSRCTGAANRTRTSREAPGTAPAGPTVAGTPRCPGTRAGACRPAGRREPAPPAAPRRPRSSPAPPGPRRRTSSQSSLTGPSRAKTKVTGAAPDARHWPRPGSRVQCRRPPARRGRCPLVGAPPRLFGYATRRYRAIWYPPTAAGCSPCGSPAAAAVSCGTVASTPSAPGALPPVAAASSPSQARRGRSWAAPGRHRGCP